MSPRTHAAGGAGAGAGLARLARLLADDTRAAICLALLDGRAWSAGDLATHARVAPSTATGHLNRLIEGGLLVERRQGRHRYVELAGPDVAQLLEDLTVHAGPAPVPVRSLRAAVASATLARARTCYDHLAGRLGVAVAEAMVHKGLLRHGTDLALTDDGMAWLTATTGVDPIALRQSRRPLARACLDWTERRPHLAGAAGALICGHLFQRRWIERIGSDRAVRVTPGGGSALGDLLGLDTDSVWIPTPSADAT
jgi:DNA-binding transcriptional ArsR family regulator